MICDCDERNIFDLRFLCNSTKEAKQYLNYLDLRKTLVGINMAMDGEALGPDAVDELEDWITEMTR